jgi:antitoxin component HigA of HigAB toxin-antitoxin module
MCNDSLLGMIKKTTKMQSNSFALCIFASQSVTMNRNIEPYKGIHPGRIIDRELKKRGASQRSFAAEIGEYSQNLNAVITGRRRLTTEMAVRLENALWL